jgi:hypothetical protein
MPTYNGPNPDFKGKIVSKEQLKELEKKDKEAAKAAGVKMKSSGNKTSAELFNEKTLSEIETELIPRYLKSIAWNADAESRLQNGLYDPDCVLLDELSFAKVISWNPETKTAKIFNGIGEKTGQTREHEGIELTSGLLSDSGKIGLRSGLPVGSIVAYRWETAKMRQTIRDTFMGKVTYLDKWMDVRHIRIFAVIPESKYDVYPIPKAIKPSLAASGGA